jgi:hypothetical protein
VIADQGMAGYSPESDLQVRAWEQQRLEHAAGGQEARSYRVWRSVSVTLIPGPRLSPDSRRPGRWIRDLDGRRWGTC